MCVCVCVWGGGGVEKHPTTTVLSKSDNVMTSEHQQSHPVPGCEIKVKFKLASRMCGNSLLLPTGGEEINHVTRHKSQL